MWAPIAANYQLGEVAVGGYEGDGDSFSCQATGKLEERDEMPRRVNRHHDDVGGTM